MQFRTLLLIGSALALKCRMGSGFAPLPVTIPSQPSKLAGMTYSPYGANDECLSPQLIGQQISHVAKLTDNIRLYGADCGQLDYVMGALADFNWQGRVLVGIWTRSGEERFQAELAHVTAILKNPRYRSLVAGVTVGNEERFNGIPEDAIVSNIARVRGHLAQQGVAMPVSTVETYKLWSPGMMQHSDVVYVNIYPFYVSGYGDGSVNAAVQGALVELKELQKQVPPGKRLVVSETGWATSGSASVSFRPPNVLDQQAYIAAFQCLVATKAQIPCYFLEAYDASWKQGFSAEKHFGILDQATNLLKSNANFDVLFTRCI